MSTFTDPFDSVPVAESTHNFEGDDSDRLNSGADSPIFNNSNNNYSSFEGGDEVFEPQPSIYAEYGNGGSDGPILPPTSDMAPEEGLALREWRRENAIRLEEKEKKEKEILNQIIEEAEEYKVEFYMKRVVTCENKKTTNREREKLFVANQQKFHAEANKNYWKEIAELIPNEVPTIEKKGKKDSAKKPLIVLLQGPKPGKPTDLSRMRQILIKLKHNTPAHLKPSPPLAHAPAKDAKTSDAASVAGSSESAAIAAPADAVAAA